MQPGSGISVLKPVRNRINCQRYHFRRDRPLLSGHRAPESNDHERTHPDESQQLTCDTRCSSFETKPDRKFLSSGRLQNDTKCTCFHSRCGFGSTNASVGCGTRNRTNSYPIPDSTETSAARSAGTELCWDGRAKCGRSKYLPAYGDTRRTCGSHPAQTTLL